jgi:cullin-associated NEDD8-dissociated protein 1
MSAFKFTINDNPIPGLEEALDGVMESVLNGLKDENVEVRRCTLRTINYVIHNKSSLVRHRLAKHLSSLFDQTFIKKELIREVDLGPFKHRVDDGLETRKAAFECMYTLLEKLNDVIVVADLVQPLLSG